MAVTIEEARSDHDRAGVFALRYDVYVREMRRRQQHADHGRAVVEEPDDASAILLAAKEESGRVVGTVRIHLQDAIPPSYVELYAIDAFAPFHPGQTSTTTKLMVAPEYRRSTLGVRLAQACYRVGIEAGVSFNFIDCSPAVRSFFDQLGYRQLVPDVEHPEYGRVSPLVLALRDLEYLRRVGSPLGGDVAEEEHPSVSYMRSLLEQSPLLSQP